MYKVHINSINLNSIYEFRSQRTFDWAVSVPKVIAPSRFHLDNKENQMSQQRSCDIAPNQRVRRRDMALSF